MANNNGQVNLLGVNNPAVKSLLFWNLPVEADLEALANDFIEHIKEECPCAIILDRWPRYRTIGAELRIQV